MKLNNVVSTYNRLQSFSQKTLPARLSFAIYKNLNIISVEVKNFENERIKLLQRYSKKDEKGECIIEDGHYVIDDMESFESDFNYLSDTDVDLNFFKITDDDLFDKLDDNRYDTLSVSDVSFLCNILV